MHARVGAAGERGVLPAMSVPSSWTPASIRTRRARTPPAIVPNALPRGSRSRGLSARADPIPSGGRACTSITWGRTGAWSTAAECRTPAARAICPPHGQRIASCGGRYRDSNDEEWPPWPVLVDSLQRIVAAGLAGRVAENVPFWPSGAAGTDARWHAGTRLDARQGCRLPHPDHRGLRPAALPALLSARLTNRPR